MVDNQDQILRLLWWFKGFLLGFLTGVFFIYMFVPCQARADQIFIQQDDSSGNQGDFGTLGYNTVCIPFIAGADYTIDSISIYAKLNTTPSTANALLYADSGGSISTLLDTGSNFSGFSTSFGWSTSTFSGATALTNGTQYWACASVASPNGDRYVWRQSANAGSSVTVVDTGVWISWNNSPDIPVMNVMGTPGSGGGGGSSTTTPAASDAVLRSETIASITFAILLAMLIYFFIKLFTPSRRRRV
jgi:hypothetical protein